jgi:hypothetical protein
MIIYDEPIESYHSNPAWGSSQARVFARSPQESHDEWTGLKVREDRGCLQIGRLAHMMVLEPAKFAACVVSDGPINPKTGKAYGRDTNAFKAWQSENPEVIFVESWLHIMLDRMPPEIRKVFESGQPETTVRVDATDDDPSMQCRTDWQRQMLTVYDLKTIDRLEKIDKDISVRQYYIQQGWYERTIMRETGQRPEQFHFIFAEKVSPWRWQLVTLDDDYREEGYTKATQIARDIRSCEMANDFRDYTTRHRIVSMPYWMGEVTQNEDGSISI